MFGDLMGNMEEKQAEMKAKLSAIQVEAEAGDGAIRVTANANREILNISINKSNLDWDDSEQLEDLLLVAMNRVIEKATAKEAEESQKMIQNMLPPGMSGMFGM